MTADQRDDITAGEERLADGEDGDEVEILEVLDPDTGDEAPGAADDEGGEDVEELRREIADLRDRSMRTLADFDNFRKRSERERREAIRYAAAAPLGELLEVLDNLERALAAGGSADDLKRGVEMTMRQLEEVLKRHGVERFDALGQPFDPAHHEAVSRLEDSGVEEPTVVEELQRGYRLHERLLRPSRVVVAVPPEEG
ncbi:MAG TPA: nucleotide exchange factor GrpE [Thermoanaerobaculia bacterium]|nr:nucleotide exchange factor GrpE [Thermoanaerobaculia bacterium]